MLLPGEFVILTSEEAETLHRFIENHTTGIDGEPDIQKQRKEGVEYLYNRLRSYIAKKQLDRYLG